MNFGEALEALKAGKKITRLGWNGGAKVIIPRIPQRPQDIDGRCVYDEPRDLTFVKLSTGKIAIADGCMYEKLSPLKWCEDAGGYAYRTDYSNGKTHKKTLKMHNFLFGELPEGYVLDHINGDRLDNRLCNLRIATPVQNVANTGKKTKGTSKYKGVSWDSSRSKWISSIQYDSKTHHIGRFDDEEECARAYDKKAKELYGEFAKLNFPNMLDGCMYLYLVEGRKIPVDQWAIRDSASAPTEREYEQGYVEILPHIDMYTVDRSGRRARLSGWLASQTDMLSEDWEVVE